MSEVAGLGLVWFAFIAWLMWNSKTDKETFLFYAWVVVLGSVVVEAIYHLFFK